MGRTGCWTIFACHALLAAEGLQVDFNRVSSSQYLDPYRHFLRSGQNIEVDLIGYISQAKRRLWLAAYEIRLPLVAKALVSASLRGVDVRIVTENENRFTLENLLPEGSFDNEWEASRLKDYFAYVDLNQNLILEDHELEAMDALRILKKAQIPLVDDREDGSKGSGLMHHKFLVIDDHLTFTGSGNFTWSDFHGDKSKPWTRGNSNNFLLIESQSVNQDFAEEFLILWGDGPEGEKNSRFGVKKPYRGPRQHNLADGSKVTIQFGATSKTYGWEASPNGLIAQELRRTRSSFQAAIFVWSEQLLADALPAKVRATSEVFIDSFFAYRSWSELLDVLGVSMLSDTCKIEAGNSPWSEPALKSGSVYLNSGDLLHHKFAILDSNRVITGSHNWSANANQNNDEVVLVIESPDIAQKYQGEFERIATAANPGQSSKLMEKISNAAALCTTQP